MSQSRRILQSMAAPSQPKLNTFFQTLQNAKTGPTKVEAKKPLSTPTPVSANIHTTSQSVTNVVPSSSHSSTNKTATQIPATLAPSKLNLASKSDAPSAIASPAKNVESATPKKAQTAESKTVPTPVKADLAARPMVTATSKPQGDNAKKQAALIPPQTAPAPSPTRERSLSPCGSPAPSPVQSVSRSAVAAQKKKRQREDEAINVRPLHVKPWTKDEESRLKSLYDKYGNKQDGIEFIVSMIDGRTKAGINAKIASIQKAAPLPAPTRVVLTELNKKWKIWASDKIKGIIERQQGVHTSIKIEVDLNNPSDKKYTNHPSVFKCFGAFGFTFEFEGVDCQWTVPSFQVDKLKLHLDSLYIETVEATPSVQAASESMEQKSFNVMLAREKRKAQEIDDFQLEVEEVEIEDEPQPEPSKKKQRVESKDRRSLTRDSEEQHQSGDNFFTNFSARRTMKSC